MTKELDELRKLIRVKPQIWGLKFYNGRSSLPASLSLCISFEDREYVNEATSACSSDELQRLQSNIWHQRSNPSDGRQGDMPPGMDIFLDKQWTNSSLKSWQMT